MTHRVVVVRLASRVIDHIELFDNLAEAQAYAIRMEQGMFDAIVQDLKNL